MISRITKEKGGTYCFYMHVCYPNLGLMCGMALMILFIELYHWKFFLVIFNAGIRHNYGKETINSLQQYDFLIPKRLAEQIKVSLCINTKGIKGDDIPLDLH